MAQDQCILSITTRKRNSKDAPNLFIINNLANYSLVPGPSNQGSFQMFTFVPQPIRRRSPSSNSSLTQQILLQVKEGIVLLHSCQYWLSSFVSVVGLNRRGEDEEGSGVSSVI
ncbi:hypothetical protein V6Z12_A06G059500 [Gossypium hirsutum]|uniref:Uncharacterized protein isoform X2 n=1 Tax=Gossypium hirsutum TaxID=3635 RepID=A0ABM3BVC3_GOSHI|nr:uncharacterized protein LOC107962561 isoform X2 [Gossypium hirsutum]XP_040971010.1 uncharacterized protein LOC107962561 isoform X2 [Gossypium hirsutum]